ncbi:MAG TPA: prepilin peptidase [Caulobacteraceae bacterium]
MAANWASWIAPGLFLALLAIAGISDIVRRTIPNWTVIALIVVWIGAAIAGQTVGAWYYALLSALIAFGVGYVFYLFGIMGAGDAKLFSAVGLFTGLDWLMQFALITALLGGVLAVVYLLIRPRKALRGLTARGRAEAEADGKQAGIPYGVPIALAAAAACYLNGFAQF